ncbi:uncharacterized protein LOC116162101 [Photinus pyralis]|uniref:uncharacterized protein LOC116162101 n=1 Tax=Photinus pyralis TaxID=7054 RepID=UPI0012670E35|nr:uncharacterized protein LOC116162101 [Photinus pyralis]
MCCSFEKAILVCLNLFIVQTTVSSNIRVCKMSDSDAVDIPDESQNNDEMHFIAEKVKMYPEILEKSQVPTMKLKKKRALEGIIQDYKAMFGKAITEKDFMKKVNNMKTRLKKKTDRNQTGNRPIRLLPWENIMLETMQGDKNPVVSRISGDLQIGVTPQSVNTSQPGSSVVPSPPLDVVESKSRSITPKLLDVRKRVAEAAPIRHKESGGQR